ncbi:unnamed protein product, partial [Chrysoparadoxa australica]
SPTPSEELSPIRSTLEVDFPLTHIGQVSSIYIEVCNPFDTVLTKVSLAAGAVPKAVPAKHRASGQGSVAETKPLTQLPGHFGEAAALSPVFNDTVVSISRHEPELLEWGDSRLSNEEAFFISQSGVDELPEIAPGGCSVLGPVYFRPGQKGQYHSEIYVRNSVSFVEAITLSGTAGLGELSITHGQTEGAEFSEKPIDGKFVVGAEGWYTKQGGALTAPKIVKRWQMSNRGNMPLTVEDLSIGALVLTGLAASLWQAASVLSWILPSLRAGSNRGFQLETTATLPFTLGPGESTWIEVSFTADCSTYSVARQLSFKSNAGVAIVQLHAVLEDSFGVCSLVKSPIIWHDTRAAALALGLMVLALMSTDVFRRCYRLVGSMHKPFILGQSIETLQELAQHRARLKEAGMTGSTTTPNSKASSRSHPASQDEGPVPQPPSNHGSRRGTSTSHSPPTVIPTLRSRPSSPHSRQVSATCTAAAPGATRQPTQLLSPNVTAQQQQQQQAVAKAVTSKTSQPTAKAKRRPDELSAGRPAILDHHESVALSQGRTRQQRSKVRGTATAAAAAATPSAKHQQRQQQQQKQLTKQVPTAIAPVEAKTELRPAAASAPQVAKSAWSERQRGSPAPDASEAPKGGTTPPLTAPKLDAPDEKSSRCESSSVSTTAPHTQLDQLHPPIPVVEPALVSELVIEVDEALAAPDTSQSLDLPSAPPATPVAVTKPKKPMRASAGGIWHASSLARSAPSPSMPRDQPLGPPPGLPAPSPKGFMAGAGAGPVLPMSHTGTLLPPPN